MFSYFNNEDKRVLCVLFCLSSGSLRGDGSGVDIKVTNDGWELVLSEKWDEHFTNAELYYHRFPHAHNETQTEFDSRKHAMMDCVRAMRTNSM